MPDATAPVGFGRPDLTTFARLDRLGLEVVGQRLEPDRAVQGADGVVLRDNAIGTYGLTDQYVCWVLAAKAGAQGAPVRDVSVIGNTIYDNSPTFTPSAPADTAARLIGPTSSRRPVA